MYRAFSGISKLDMAPIFDRPTTDKYDYVVIGGGSGGSGTSVSGYKLFFKNFFISDASFLVLSSFFFSHREELLLMARKLLW